MIKDAWEGQEGIGLSNAKGFTLTEVIVATALSVMIMGATVAAFAAAKDIFSAGENENVLQQAAGVALNKIIKGVYEPGGTFRLSEGVKPDSTVAQVENEFYFTGTDNRERRIHLSADATAILYFHPTDAGMQDEAIYTAPQGAVITLRFWDHPSAVVPQPGGGQPLIYNVYSGINKQVDVGISQTVQGRTVTGYVTTMVNLRNHSS